MICTVKLNTIPESNSSDQPWYENDGPCVARPVDEASHALVVVCLPPFKALRLLLSQAVSAVRRKFDCGFLTTRAIQNLERPSVNVSSHPARHVLVIQCRYVRRGPHPWGVVTPKKQSSAFFSMT